jgi:hypothetical protein
MSSPALSQWLDPDLRERLVDNMCRWLSKTGDLRQYSGELSAASTVLSEEAVLELYTRFASERLEFEWREQLFEFMPNAARLVPEPLVAKELLGQQATIARIVPVEAKVASSALAQQRLTARKRWWAFWGARK